MKENINSFFESYLNGSELKESLGDLNVDRGIILLSVTFVENRKFGLKIVVKRSQSSG